MPPRDGEERKKPGKITAKNYGDHLPELHRILPGFTGFLLRPEGFTETNKKKVAHVFIDTGGRA